MARRRAFVFVFTSCLVFFANADSVRADILNISDGAASFRYDSDNPNSGNADLSSTSDILFQESWFLLYNDPTSGSQIVELTNGLATSNGNQGSLSFVGVGASGGNTGFNVELNYEIHDTGGVPALRYFANVTNTNSSAENVSLFHYFDHDIDGELNDVAVFDTSSFRSVSFSDDTTDNGSFRTFAAVNSFQIADYGDDLYGQLRSGALTSLDNTNASFGPGDFTAALQWDLNLQTGQTLTFAGSVAIPEPKCFRLLAAVAGLLLLRRQR